MWAQSVTHSRQNDSVSASASSASVRSGERLVRRVPRQHERDAIAGGDLEVGDGVEVPADQLDRGREEERVGPGDGEQAVLAPADPRDDRAVVEPDAQAHLHRDGSLDALDDAHDVRRLAARRHEVDQPDGAVLARELGLEDQRVVAVPAPGRRDLAAGLSHHRPFSSLPRSAAKHAPESKRGKQQPVDAAVPRDERGGLQVADEAVVLDPCGHAERLLPLGLGRRESARACGRPASLERFGARRRRDGWDVRPRLLVLVGVGHEDTPETAERLAARDRPAADLPRRGGPLRPLASRHGRRGPRRQPVHAPREIQRKGTGRASPTRRHRSRRSRSSRRSPRLSASSASRCRRACSVRVWRSSSSTTAR